MRSIYRVAVCGAVLFGLVCGWSYWWTSPVLAEGEATLDVPQVVIDEPLNEWTIASGMAYWALRCYGGEFVWDGYLRRKPLNGTIIRTLGTVTPSNCVTYLNMNADSDGVYYYNAPTIGDVVKGIYFRPAEDPYDPPRLLHAVSTDFPADLTRLVPAGNHLYWITTTQIRRVPKDGSDQVQIVANTNGAATDLMVLGTTAYWLDNGGLRSAPVNCDTLPCPPTTILGTTRGSALFVVPPGNVFTFSIYWVETNSGPEKIRRHSCNLFTPQCTTTTIYTVPGDAPWKIGRPAGNSTHLFFEEAFFTFDSGQERRVRRVPIQTNATGATLFDELLGSFPGPVFVDSQYMYFAENSIRRLPFDATAITRDLAAVQLEVTQGIQNLSNQAPLVAEKPTYVRAYGFHSAGPIANTVEARLHGTRNGTPLPGSPLKPVNGTRPLQAGVPINRSQTDTNWLFQLPHTWISAGNVEFRLEVDPRQIYDDPARGNNTLTRTVSFVRKAPICQVFIPVRTHAPAASTNLSIFWPMVNMSKRLLPTADIWAYKQNSDVAETQVCWAGPFPYPCFGPYEIPDDGWKIMSSLWIRDQFSDDPDACDTARARTHYTGLIHPSTNTGGLNGRAHGGGDQLFVHMPPLNAAPLNWRNSPRVATLAHELGHNYSREHVNCGGPADPDGGYPYTNPDSCRLDDRPLDQPTTYFGFDLEMRTPIPPVGGSVRDLMAYGATRWPSDYTWRAIFNGLKNRAGSIDGAWIEEPAQPAEVSHINLVSSHGTVLITGGITPTLEQGELDYAWVMPPGAASSGMLRKWQRYAEGGIYGLEPGEVAPAGITADKYFIRLIGVGEVVLGEPHEVTLLVMEDSDNERIAFAATFAAPEATVIRIELLADDTVIATRAPGTAQPQVSISQPAGGEVFDAQLTVGWTATDPNAQDDLLVIIQYSHNDGETWRTLISDYGIPGGQGAATLNFANVLDIPSSNGPTARIRVIASDGYNTSTALSAPFTVVNRKPEPYIVTPADGAAYPVDEILPLRGGGFDVEDGGLPDEALEWTLSWSEGDISAGTGSEISFYGLSTGIHTATLTAEDSVGATAATSSTFRLLPLHIPLSGAPLIDGQCEDAAYAGATQVRLAPYADNEEATAHLIQTGSSLYVCFTGLMTGTFQLPDSDPSDIKNSFVGVRIDPNLSREGVAQADDYGFFVGYDGGIFTYAGNGAGGFDAPGPGGVQAQIHVTGGLWTAEMQIDLAVVGGSDHPIGIKLGHYWVDTQGDDYGWPHVAGWNQPNTWAESALGLRPRITAYTPVSTTLPSGEVVLVIEGSGFVDGAVVRWEATELETQFGSTELLTATIPAATINTPGAYAITVRNPAGAGLVSDPVNFEVYGQAPVITSLSPDQVNAMAEGFTLQIDGTGFLPGATVFWNDVARSTLFVDNGRLEVQIPATELEIGGTVGVTVVNPEPDGQASNTVNFTVNPEPAITTPSLFVPRVDKAQ